MTAPTRPKVAYKQQRLVGLLSTCLQKMCPALKRNGGTHHYFHVYVFDGQQLQATARRGKPCLSIAAIRHPLASASSLGVFGRPRSNLLLGAGADY